jgi:hypothetical protein
MWRDIVVFGAAHDQLSAEGMMVSDAWTGEQSLHVACVGFVNLLLWCALRAARTEQDGSSIVIPGSHVRIYDNGVLQDHEAG